MTPTTILRAIADALFCAGAALIPVALWCLNWQAGLVGCGLLLIVVSIALRGLIHKAATDKERRRR